MPSSLMAQQQPVAPAVEQQQQQTQEHTAALADPWNGRNGRALLRQLLCSEEKIRSMREAVIAQTCNLEYITKNEQPKSQRVRVFISEFPILLRGYFYYFLSFFYF